MLTAVVADMSLSDGRWHWIVVEVVLSSVSLLLDNSLLIHR